MTDPDRDIVAHEIYLARRVGRLFRAERTGKVARRSGDFIETLVRRRGEMIGALVRAEAARRALRLPSTPELHAAIEALNGEAARSMHSADRRLQELRADLLLARGDGIPTGIRGAAGRLIGTG